MAAGDEFDVVVFLVLLGTASGFVSVFFFFLLLQVVQTALAEVPVDVQVPAAVDTPTPGAEQASAVQAPPQGPAVTEVQSLNERSSGQEPLAGGCGHGEHPLAVMVANGMRGCCCAWAGGVC
jgi:hypothetical protein